MMHSLPIALLRPAVLFGMVLLAAPGHGQQPLPDPLTLEHALSLADEYHPTLEVAAARLEAAQAGLLQVEADNALQAGVEAKARLVDPVSISPDRSNNDSSARFYLRKQIYDFGESDARREAAGLGVRGSEWDYLDARQQRRLQIMRAYFDVLLADLAYTRDNEAIAIDFIAFDRAKDRHELGQLSDVELLRLESEFQATRNKWVHSQSQQLATRNRLALALNRPNDLPANLVMPTAPDVEQPIADVDSLTAEVLAGNPGLAALRARLKAAEQSVIAGKAAGGPSLHAEFDAQAVNRETGSSHPLGAGLVLEWPLYDGGRTDAELAARRAEVRRLRATLAQQELVLRQTVLGLRLKLDQTKARLQELAVKEAYRDLYLDRSRALYELEVRTDLGDAMTQTSAVQHLLAEARFDWLMARAQLQALTGKLLPTSPNEAQKEDTP